MATDRADGRVLSESRIEAEPKAASPSRQYVVRFNRTQRLVHAVQAVTFLLMLGTGLAIGITQLESLIGHRALLRQIHLTTAFFFVFGPALITLAGDRLSVWRDAREIESWSQDDVRWLRKPALKPGNDTPPPGRYNTGQKLNALFTVYCTLAFAATGLIMWQNRRFPLPLVSQANTIHTLLAYVALLAFLGHLFLSVVWPATRHSLRGIFFGTVRRDWARSHYPNWKLPSSPEPRLRMSVLLRSSVILLLGLEVAALVSRFGFEALGANTTDPVTKLLYSVSGLPGTAHGALTGARLWDFGALLWAGVIVALWYGAMRTYSLLPRIFPAPAKG